jgi:hypothetical protein
MPSHSKSKQLHVMKIPSERQADLDRLREQVRHAEGHDQHDTCHHIMLARLESELGLIPARKIEEQKDVDNGEQNL